MNNLQENYCCEEGLTPGYGGGCQNKENYLVERRGGGGGGGHGGGGGRGGGRGGWGGGGGWGYGGGGWGYGGGGWGYGEYPYMSYYDDGLYYDNCPKDYHYDPNHLKADNNGCVKDMDTCPTGSHYHPEHAKSDSKGCMKDEDMIEKYTKSRSLMNTNLGPNFLIFTGIFIVIILILFLIYHKL
jgi:hypothetical protein